MAFFDPYTSMIGLGMGMGMGGMGGLGMGYGGYGGMGGGMMSMMPGMSVSARPDRIVPLSSSRSLGLEAWWGCRSEGFESMLRFGEILGFGIPG
jgi:hypothetical protein